MITVWKRESAAGGLVLAPHVSLVFADDGTARLLDMGGGFYALSAIGAEMLRGALERGVAASAADVAERYGVGTGRVEADLATLLRELRQRRLIQDSARPRRDPWLWLALAVVPCLWLVRAAPFGWGRVFLTLTLARLALLCFGWGRTVTAWQRALRRWSPPDGAPVDGPTVRGLNQAVRDAAAGHPLPMACKERALASWALARWAGAPAALVVGLEFFPLMGHCWCEAGPWILSDDEENCEPFTPVARYA
jgi:hypothetical protein